MHPINERAHTMEQQNNSQLPWILHRQSQRTESAGSNKFRAVDFTILPFLNTISERKSSTTKNTEAAITNFLDYAATNPSTIIQYKASDMILHIDSDASYLSELRSCSRTGGHYYLSTLPIDQKKSPNLPPSANGPIHMECIILKNVVASAAEAEVGRLFHNGKTTVPPRITLHELGFTQTSTPTKIDNSAAEDIVTTTVRQKRSKSMDMRFYWMKDTVKQKDFFVYW